MLIQSSEKQMKKKDTSVFRLPKLLTYLHERNASFVENSEYLQRTLKGWNLTLLKYSFQLHTFCDEIHLKVENCQQELSIVSTFPD